MVEWSAVEQDSISEDRSHPSWFLMMSLNTCKQILALTFYDVFSPENYPIILVFNSSKGPVIWKNAPWYLLKHPQTQLTHRNTYSVPLVLGEHG